MHHNLRLQHCTCQLLFFIEPACFEHLPFSIFAHFLKIVLPTLGRNHIFGDRPIGTCIKNITFWPPLRKEKEPLSSFCSMQSLLCPFASFFFRSMGAFFASKSPAGDTTSCTTTFNSCIVRTICSFSSVPTALSTSLVQSVFTF